MIRVLRTAAAGQVRIISKRAWGVGTKRGVRTGAGNPVQLRYATAGAVYEEAVAAAADCMHIIFYAAFSALSRKHLTVRD